MSDGLNMELLGEDVLAGGVKESTRDGFGKGLLAAGEVDDRVVAICADLTESTRMHWFAEAYPERFVRAGVAEQNMSGVASGMAAVGKVPFMASFGVFSPGRNWEQIRTTICYNKTNVKVVATHNGLSVGEDGATHQALEDIALTRVLPGMTVLVPADARQAEAAVAAALEIDGPVYLRLGREKLPVVYGEDVGYEVGVARVLREGGDVTVVACGLLVWEALQAAEQLAGKGIGVTVIDGGSVKPLDEKVIVGAAERTGAVVVAEEHQVAGGLGGAVAELLGRGCPVRMGFVGMRDRFGESGSADELLEKYELNAAGIVAEVRRVLAVMG